MFEDVVRLLKCNGQLFWSQSPPLGPFALSVYPFHLRQKFRVIMQRRRDFLDDDLDINMQDFCPEILRNLTKMKVKLRYLQFVDGADESDEDSDMTIESDPEWDDNPELDDNSELDDDLSAGSWSVAESELSDHSESNGLDMSRFRHFLRMAMEQCEADSEERRCQRAIRRICKWSIPFDLDTSWIETVDIRLSNDYRVCQVFKLLNKCPELKAINWKVNLSPDCPEDLAHNLLLINDDVWRKLRSFCGYIPECICSKILSTSYELEVFVPAYNSYSCQLGTAWIEQLGKQNQNLRVVEVEKVDITAQLMQILLVTHCPNFQRLVSRESQKNTENELFSLCRARKVSILNNNCPIDNPLSQKCFIKYDKLAGILETTTNKFAWNSLDIVNMANFPFAQSLFLVEQTLSCEEVKEIISKNLNLAEVRLLRCSRITATNLKHISEYFRTDGRKVNCRILKCVHQVLEDDDEANVFSLAHFCDRT